MLRTRIILALVAVTCLVGGIALAVHAQTGLPDKDVVMGDDLKLTSEMQEWVEGHVGRRGVYTEKFGGHILVLIARGRFHTGGYTANIEDVSFLEAHPPAGSTGSTEPAGKWVIDVSLTDPEEGRMVTQVITYPYAVVAVRDSGAGIEVRDVTDGAEPIVLPQTSTR